MSKTSASKAFGSGSGFSKAFPVASAGSAASSGKSAAGGASSSAASGSGKANGVLLSGGKALTPLSAFLGASISQALVQSKAAEQNKSDPAKIEAVQVVLASDSDTGTKGDNRTTVSVAQIEITRIAPGALVWLDKDGNGQFDAGKDSAVTVADGRGVLSVPLVVGQNALTFYQMVDKSVSPPAYLVVTREGSSEAKDPLAAPLVQLVAEDDDGVAGDRVTSKSLVRLKVSSLDSARQIAWIDTDGNGAYDLTKDIAIPSGGTEQTVTVALEEGINGFQVYQQRDGLISAPGSISIYRVRDTDVVRPGKTASYAGTTISLEFDRPVDWKRLDTSGDNKLSIRNLNVSDSGELQVAWGSNGKNPPRLNNSELAVMVVEIPPFGSRFLTLTGVSITPPNANEPIDGKLTLILVGIPDVQGGVFSNVVFTI